MSDEQLPKGWAEVTLGDVCEIVGGSTPDTKTAEFWGGDVAWITPADLSNHVGMHVSRGSRNLTQEGLRACAAKILPAGSVLFSSRAPIGHVAIADGPISTNQGFKNLVPSQGISPRFLYWQMRSATPLIRSMGSGTTFTEVSGKVMKTVPIRICPTNEQQRIVDELERRLSHVDAAIGSLESAVKRLQTLEEAVIGRGISGGLLNLDTSGWVKTTIGDQFEVAVGTTPRRKEESFWGGDVPWVSSGEVAWGRISSTRETLTRAANPRIHPTGTILLAMIGEGKTRGQAAILDVEAAHNQNCASIRVGMTSNLPEWIFYQLRAKYFDTRKSGSGNNQQALNKSLVQAIRISLPEPECQAQLVREMQRRLSIVEAVRSVVDQGIERTQVIRRSLLAAAFSGRLVPQDPNDEPAEVLLTQIREERAVPAASSSGKKAASRPRETKQKKPSA